MSHSSRGRTALIGHTGFVGGALVRQSRWDRLYNSANIAEIAGQEFDLLVCAGAPAEKWKANAHPEQDRANLQRLMNSLGKCTAGRCVLISTVDVYPAPQTVDERTPIDDERLQPYGRHRRELEQFVIGKFPRSHVVRLPALFGHGLKKNFLFDLLHDNCLDWTDHRSYFQFYDMQRLWQDLQRVLELGLPLINFATEPVQCAEVARRAFDRSFAHETSQPPVRYDLRTLHAAELGGRGSYLYDAAESLARIREFVTTERGARTAT